MKILILANNDGGLYQFRRELIETLVNENEVVCCVPNEDGYYQLIEKLGCRCISIQMNRRGMNLLEEIQLYTFYTKVLKHECPDIVLTYTIKPNVYGGIACQKRRIPYIANITGLGTTIENGGLMSRMSLSLYRLGLRKAKCVFFQNATNRDFFYSKGIVGKNAIVIPGSGVNINYHKLEDYSEQTGPFCFLFVGRVMRDKGIGELLESIERMVDEGKNVFLDIAGASDEDYSEKISQLEHRGIIKYHGEQKNIHEYYKRAHCVVLPSYHEGMANVVLEAASTGRPIITCNIPGCQEGFDEGITGYGCEPKSVTSLKAAMDKMYSTPWEKRREMGLMGRKKVKEQFDRKIIINAYQKQINSLK